jgi:hypothetical protein
MPAKQTEPSDRKIYGSGWFLLFSSHEPYTSDLKDVIEYWFSFIFLTPAIFDYVKLKKKEEPEKAFRRAPRAVLYATCEEAKVTVTFEVGKAGAGIHLQAFLEVFHEEDWQIDTKAIEAFLLGKIGRDVHVVYKLPRFGISGTAARRYLKKYFRRKKTFAYIIELQPLDPEQEEKRDRYDLPK